MERLIQLFAVLMVLALTFTMVSVSTSDQPQAQKDPVIKGTQVAQQQTQPGQPRVFKGEDLKHMKPGDLRDTDIIEFKDRKMTFAELKNIARKQMEVAANKAREQFLNAAAEKLRKIKSEESSRRTARVNSLKQEIASRKQKLGAKLPKCNSPKINWVYPTTVHPGDPIVITGCGFLSQLGQAALSTRGGRTTIFPITITSWSDNAIEGTVPNIQRLDSDIEVYAKIQTSQGAKSPESERITLTPLIDHRYVCPQGFTQEICESFGGTIFVNSPDPVIHTLNISLMNNWKVERVDFSCSVLFILWPGDGDLYACNWPRSGAVISSGPNPGDTAIGRISINWIMDSAASGMTGINLCGVFPCSIYYSGLILIKGPMGSTP